MDGVGAESVKVARSMGGMRARLRSATEVGKRLRFERGRKPEASTFPADKRNFREVFDLTLRKSFRLARFPIAWSSANPIASLDDLSVIPRCP